MKFKEWFNEIFHLFKFEDITDLFITGILGIIAQFIASQLPKFIDGFTFYGEVSFKFNGTLLMATFLLLYLIILIVRLIYRYKYRYYSSKGPKYDYKNSSIRIDMQFKNRTKIDYIKTIEINSIKCDRIISKYLWSGSEVEKIVLVEGYLKDYKLTTIDEKQESKQLGDNGEVTDSDSIRHSSLNLPLGKGYIIQPKNSGFIKNAKFAILFKLLDDNYSMTPSSGITIDRPTKEIQLSLTIPEELNILSVKVKRELVIGRLPAQDITAKYLKVIKNHGYKNGHLNNKGKTYVAHIKNPKLFYTYCLIWEWEEK